MNMSNQTNAPAGTDYFFPIVSDEANYINAKTEINSKKYNIILLAEFNHRSIRIKLKHFKRLPFACLFGYFDGPDRNQTLFSYAAFCRIFKIALSSDFITTHAKPYVNCSFSTQESVVSLKPALPYVVIAVGGVDPYRTYSNWAGLLKKYENLTNLKIINVVLVGSGNGKSDAELLERQSYIKIKIINLVGKISLLQTRSIIMDAELFIGCDGGLMHIAHSTGIPTVTLFGVNEPSHLRLTPACNSRYIQSTGAVSEIQPEAILERVIHAFGLHSAS